MVLNVSSAMGQVSTKLSLVSFGDASCKQAKKRLVKQAQKSRYFQEIWVWGEEDLEPTFRSRNAHRLVTGSRGFGYWLWKPQVVLQALRMIPEGSTLLYVDVGSHILPKCEQGINRYLTRLAESDSDVLCSTMEHREKDWAKGDLFDYLNVRYDRQVTHTGQRQGGVVFYRKTASSEDFVQEWLRICEDQPNLLDDSPSRSANFDGFREHRHDQAVFSVLSKIYSVETFDEKELMQWDDATEKLPGCFPLETRRDRYPKEPLFRRLMSRLGAPKRALVKFLSQTHRR